MRFGVLVVILLIGILYVAISQSFISAGGAVDKKGIFQRIADFAVIKPIIFEDKPRAVSPRAIASPSVKSEAATKSSIEKGQQQEKSTPSSATVIQEKPKLTPPPGFTEDQLSPFYQKIVISDFKPTRSDTRGAFTLSSTFSSTDFSSINVTGWRLKGNKNDYVIIPGDAVSDFDPTYYTKGDIIMYPQDSLRVYGGRNFLTSNMRLNKCTGYLNEKYSPIPPFPNDCPEVDFNRRNIINFSGQCQSLILSFNSCREPSTKEWGIIGSDHACADFLKNMTGYKNCYAKYRRDNNFFSNIWYAWLNLPGEMPFDSKHDYIRLVDKNELLVSEYIY